MKQTKLELYIDILNVLRYNGPLTFTQIINKSNVNSIVLKGHLRFLIKQGLVEDQTFRKNRAVFAVTHRGTNVLGYFLEFHRVTNLV
jgi:predicted transcriptional regulator